MPTGQSKQRYRNICVICNGNYTATRSDSKYCSTRCRNTDTNAKAQRLSTRLTEEQKILVLKYQERLLMESAK